ncbi:MAG TPA: hypothetical protein VN618_00395 [Solirubrobacteraceae bacterium]|nr:hypothetical protein [Solirubrobacteraceae bacterium]
MSARRLPPALLGAAILALLTTPSQALGAAPAGGQQRAKADSPPVTADSSPNTRAPRAATLLPQAPAVEEAASEGGAQTQIDPLVTNGLGSPSCRSALEWELAREARRDCETSGFLAAPAPTDNYGLDVHIDTGVLPLSGGGLLSTVQSMFVTPEWLGLVWLVHAVLVMLEWAFTLDLIDSGATTGLTAGLARSEAAFTTPLLALALPVSSIILAYHGLIRRRVAQSLGEAALTLAMTGAGLWLMLDPTGTVGALGRWSDQATLGVLAVASEGSPATPGRALGSHLGGIFSAAVEGPWCYLEFGNVAWCRDRDRLEPEVRRAALRIAAKETRESGCAAGACKGASRAGLLTSARMLREARTNGALFLSLPPNGPARNSINDEWSLLHALCGGSEATNCPAPGAAEAEFRTNAGTWPRVTGLILILAGLAGMLLLFGYLAVRLLTAAVMSLLFLLMAPGVVLAPAFGERGRALFRAWAGRLFGAVVAKLVFAFLLGVLFAATSAIEDVSVLGWWAQWLLLCAFWWVAFLRRHHLLAVPPTILRDGEGATRSTIRRTRIAREATGRLGSWRDRRRERLQQAAAGDVAQARAAGGAPRFHGSPGAGSSTPDPLAAHLVDTEARLAPTEIARADGRIARRAGRQKTIETELGRARAGGQRRRAMSLELRAERLRAATAVDESLKSAAVEAARSAEGPARAGRLAERARHLDAQTELRAAGRRGAGPARDYPSLAPLAGLSRSQYAGLAPGPQRAARLEIDRELTARLERIESIRHHAKPGRNEDHAPARREAEEVSRGPVRSRPVPPVERRRPSPNRPSAAEESPVMRDAMAVAEGRKRQLGYDRP